jgi:hypothetical protein
VVQWARKSRDACCWGRGSRTGAPRRGKWGVGGEGAEKLENKRKKVANLKQGSYKAKEKRETVKKRKRLLHEEGNEAQKQQHEAVGGRRASGDSVKKKHEKYPHNCQSR